MSCQVRLTTVPEGAVALRVLGAAGGVAWANNILFVVDSNRFSADPVNNRVLLFPTNTLPSLTQALTLGLIGYPYVLPDMIGGNAYEGEVPDAELMIRWTQRSLRHCDIAMRCSCVRSLAAQTRCAPCPCR